MERYASFIKSLVAQGGPTPEDYPALDGWLSQVADDIELGTVRRAELDALLTQFGEVFQASTMQGFARCKPHGYAGDFEIIDRIYRCHTAADPQLANWDHYFHAQGASRAVRNRKAYFHEVLTEVERAQPSGAIRVLNLASGPARDLYEYFSAYPDTRLVFSCVEQDEKAIAHARGLCRDHLHRLEFQQKNVLRFRTSERFDLIWSAGLFDYLNDRAFCLLLKRFYSCLNEGGQMIIGNFAPHNPTRRYMELIGDWHLLCRSASELRRLASSCGVELDAVEVRQEAEGVNLFLHITKQAQRLAAE